MSTTDSTSATPGVLQSIDVARLPLPSFAPAYDTRNRRESQAESSTSGSRWSAGDRRSHSPAGFPTSLSNAGSDGKKPDRPASSTFPRRDQHRSSGGFLLEPTTHSSRLSRAVLSRSHYDPKGKRKSDHSEILVPKRRTKQTVLDQEPSQRGSPLSVKRDRNQSEDQRRQDADLGVEETSQAQPGLQNGLSGTPSSRRSNTSSVGLDSDPAQIVDMALKLSEGRRRQASGRRFVSGETQGKRVISTATSRQLRTPTKSLGQYVTTSAGTYGSLLSEDPIPNGNINEDNDPMQLDDPFSSPTLHKFRSNIEEDVEISRATIARADKAKIYIELAYEHRRLLSHLPPVQRPGGREKSMERNPHSKIYNPLQYARNRKLRIREKSAINAEAEGWHDVEKVRAWVDAVINSHTETNHDPLECVRLPPLSLKEDDEDNANDGSQRASPTSPRSAKKQQIKPRRPKSDWVTHPGDLIADAFWLEQGLNKTKIQDRDNNPIYPPNTPFKFSGWRNRTPIDVPERFQQLTPPPKESPIKEKLPVLATAPQLPTFRSAHKSEKDTSRGRKQSKLKTSSRKTHNESGRRRMALLDSSSDSDSVSDASSDKSDRAGDSCGRKRKSEDFSLRDGDPFGRPISSLYKDSDVNRLPSSSDLSLSGRHSNRSSIDNSRLVNYLKRNSVLKPSSRERGRSRGNKKKERTFRNSHDTKAGNSTEDDSAAPDSPVHYGLPSIAINLDAPISRSPSPTKKSKHGFLQSFKDKSKYSDHDKVETTDFATRNESSHSREASVDHDRSRESSNQASRGTSPFTRGASPSTRLRRESTHKDDSTTSPIDHRASTISRQSTKLSSVQHQDQPSRIRGIFKGGRIAELVGNEVSRVGDFIWKRDIPPAYRRQMSESETSIRTFDSSATDEDAQNGYVHKPAPRDARLSISTQSSGGRRSYETPKGNEKLQLHNPNLPSFTSPFQRDRERMDKKQELLVPGDPFSFNDHVSRQAAHHRNRSKSPRLDRLALPKLDTSAPRSVGVIERRNSYGFGAALNRSQSASRTFNEAMIAKSSKTASARSSIAGLSGHLRRPMTEVLGKDSTGKVDKRDLARIESLLLISAVKAKAITSSYEQILPEPSSPVTNMETYPGDLGNVLKSLQVRKRDEHIFAARSMITQLTNQTVQINDLLHSFTDDAVGRLHRDIQELEDQIENNITPRVRVAADNAGELSVKLTTTSTQAVKNLQDIISEAFRLRRRGPFRWVKLFWYRLIEWFVVGLLWFIWAIVTFIRIILGLFRGVGKTTRWLLWID